LDEGFDHLTVADALPAVARTDRGAVGCEILTVALAGIATARVSAARIEPIAAEYCQ
jgi:hypothetical protein